MIDAQRRAGRMQSTVKSTLVAAAVPTPAGSALALTGSTGDGAVDTPDALTAPGLPLRTAEQLRTELQQQEALVGLLRQRLADAETANSLLPWLLLVLTGCAALAAWLALRLRRLQLDQARRRQPANDAVPAMPATSPGGWTSPANVAPADWAALQVDAAMPAAATLAPAPATPPRTAPAAASGSAPPVPARQAVPRAAPAPVVRRSTSVEAAASIGELTQAQPVRPVSVDELLDLEQQVDFFLVIGQDEAAVDLLSAHIRDTGGTSALPFLKLLDVYRHQGNEAGYERIRQRFNLRFNAFAPEWSADFEAGRSLEQYRDVIDRLQRLWPRPLDAMAEVEAMLYRRASGEMFDLPAYRELLLLYALSRDLNEQSPVSSIRVDVLLPLGDDPLETTSPRPHLAETNTDAQALLAEWARPLDLPARHESKGAAARRTAIRLDLDLTEFAPAPREFTRPAAFTDVDLRRDDWRSDLAALDDGREPPRKP